MLQIVLTVVVLIAVPAFAGSSIPATELAEVDAPTLEELRATEFEVFLAEVALHAARLSERAAQQELRDAKRSLELETLDLKAAKAEDRAASANVDDARKNAATASLIQASDSKETKELLLDWKEKSLQVSRRTVEQARLRQQLAEARRDLARARALQTASVAAATKHPVAPHEKQVLRLQRSYDSALARASKIANEAEQLGDRWARRNNQ